MRKKGNKKEEIKLFAEIYLFIPGSQLEATCIRADVPFL
jgi:hypothetical protein